MSQTLESIEINPDQPPVASVIWLHGLGADGNDFVPIIPELQLAKNLPVRFVFPNAPMQAVTINNGYIMRAWYDIVSLEINKHADQRGITNSVNHVHELIAREEQRGIPSEKIILAGFSQGAVIALTTGLTYAKRLGGILALSGYLPFANEVMAQASLANKTTSVFIGHGLEDPVVPYFLGEETRSVLVKHSYSVEWRSYPMPHTVCMQEIKDIRSWLVKHLF